MKHFAYVLFVGFDAQRNFCDKQNVLFYVTPRIWPWTMAGPGSLAKLLSIKSPFSSQCNRISFYIGSKNDFWLTPIVLRGRFLLTGKIFFTDFKNGNSIKMASVWLIWLTLTNRFLDKKKPFWKHVFKLLTKNDHELGAYSSKIFKALQGPWIKGSGSTGWSWDRHVLVRGWSMLTSLVYKYWRSQTMEFATISFW